MKAITLLSMLIAPTATLAEATPQEACLFYYAKYLKPELASAGLEDTSIFADTNGVALKEAKSELQRFVTYTSEEEIAPTSSRSSNGTRQALSASIVCYVDETAREVLWVGIIGGPSSGRRETREFPNASGEMAKFPFEINGVNPRTLTLKTTIEAGRY